MDGWAEAVDETNPPLARPSASAIAAAPMNFMNSSKLGRGSTLREESCSRRLRGPAGRPLLIGSRTRPGGPSREARGRRRVALRRFDVWPTAPMPFLPAHGITHGRERAGTNSTVDDPGIINNDFVSRKPVVPVVFLVGFDKPIAIVPV